MDFSRGDHIVAPSRFMVYIFVNQGTQAGHTQWLRADQFWQRSREQNAGWQHKSRAVNPPIKYQCLSIILVLYIIPNVK
jgi:hypothetical protein